jgi:hypothetical protein
MSISNTTENAWLALTYNATAWPNYADNAASTPQTQIATALHTADPGDTGSMLTSEAAYTGYGRQNINRNSGGWTVSGSNVNPVANIDFAISTGGSELEAFFSTGKTGGGAAAILLSGAVSPAISVSSGVTPRLTTATQISLD